MPTAKRALFPLSVEKSNMVPDKEIDFTIGQNKASWRDVDQDKVKLDWWFEKATGHAQPIKLLADVADRIGALFQPVNKSRMCNACI